MQKYLATLIIFHILICCNQEKKQVPAKSNLDRAKEDTAYTIIKPPNAIDWIRHENLTEISLSSDVEKHIEENYLPLDTAVGDFNYDNVDDLLLITCFAKEDSLRQDVKILKRGLYLFAGQKDGSYKLVAKNRNAIPCQNCCGMTDPFGGISISQGKVSIIKYCASNCKSIDKYTFNYDRVKNNLLLDNVISESYCFDYRDYNRDTASFSGSKRVSISKFDILKEDN